jgi:glycogen operon protein
VRCLGVQLFGDRIDVNERGEVISGDTLLLLFNADHGTTIPFTLPALDEGHVWELLIDSTDPKAGHDRFNGSDQYLLNRCCVAVFRDCSPEQSSTTARTVAAAKQMSLNPHPSATIPQALK